MKKYLIYIIAVVVIVLIGAELFLRVYYGFCDAVLATESAKYEYIAQPSQDRFRFRNTIKYNSLSMRSEEIDTAAILILGFGDSVINGGVQTDHGSLATTILSDTLTKLYNKKVQFLNIAMGSWGPDNCYAYLNEHGDLGARHIFLFVSSHDAYDNMTFEKIVDHHESYPSSQYPLALIELVDYNEIYSNKKSAETTAKKTTRRGRTKKAKDETDTTSTEKKAE